VRRWRSDATVRISLRKNVERSKPGDKPLIKW
jgi:hypothetical protein